jgi:hypothetical protein
LNFMVFPLLELAPLIGSGAAGVNARSPAALELGRGGGVERTVRRATSPSSWRLRTSPWR